MERRQEPRFAVSKTVTFRVLDRMSGPSMGKCLVGEVVDTSGRGMRLRLPLPVPCGAPVEIRDGTTLIFGQVSRCVSGNRVYTVGIQVLQALMDEVDREDDLHLAASGASS